MKSFDLYSLRKHEKPLFLLYCDQNIITFNKRMKNGETRDTFLDHCKLSLSFRGQCLFLTMLKCYLNALQTCVQFKNRLWTQYWSFSLTICKWKLCILPTGWIALNCKYVPNVHPYFNVGTYLLFSVLFPLRIYTLLNQFTTKNIQPENVKRLCKPNAPSSFGISDVLDFPWLQCQHSERVMQKLTRFDIMLIHFYCCPFFAASKWYGSFIRVDELCLEAADVLFENKTVYVHQIEIPRIQAYSLNQESSNNFR